MKVAFIIGNGPSRKKLDLNELVGKGTIFGCNALYRDFDKADFLVAIDDRMIDEIKSKLPLEGTEVIFPPEHERYEEISGRRSNAGMNAMREAIRREHDILYCIGFDFITESSFATGNVYKDTVNYEPRTQSNGDDNYWRIKYLEWYANENPNTKFIFVIPDDTATKPLDSDNIIGMRMSTFLNKLNT